MARFKSINDIVNQVLIEVGVPKQSDVFFTSDHAAIQLTNLANSVGYELLQDHPWEGLVKEHSITTSSADSGKYELPDDFAYMLEQTGWDRTNNVPLLGGASGQQWQYLLGRNLVSETIYVTFRQAQNQFWIFPSPPPDNQEITFEYISRHWVHPDGDKTRSDDLVRHTGDTVLFEPYLFERLLKLRFLEARGFDTKAANATYVKAFNSWSGKDSSSPVLNAGGRRQGVPFIDGEFNLPDSRFGH